MPVLNVAPAAHVEYPTLGVRGQAQVFTLSAAEPGAADRAAGFTFTIDWGDGTTQTLTGAPTGPDTREGDQSVAKWSSGTTELAVAGFNYGRFKKKELADKGTGYNLEFYANEELPDELKAIQHDVEEAEATGDKTFTTIGAMSTTSITISRP